jgi:diacylglycerol O-acyltransferase
LLYLETANAPLHISGLAHVQDGIGLFHTLECYCGTVIINATVFRELMPDPEFYRECLQASYDKLLAAAQTKEAA